jgi:MinD-like ATPase involved in chromosome partitioning or flagellar assembly
MTQHDAGEIITFYSYKGGTGRSMALANVACVLASEMTNQNRNGVLMIDWDLEAPGLHRYFGSWMATSTLGIDTIEEQEPVESAPGLIDLFYDLLENVEAYIDKHRTTSDVVNDTITTEEGARRVIKTVDFSSFILPTTISELSLLKAGRFDPQNPNEYSRRVNKFPWESLFTKCPHLIRVFGEELASRYSYVLIDSRTGISDISGISTMLLPEKLVVVFTPNFQSLRGGLELVRRAAGYRKESIDLRPLTVFPLVSRVEFSEEQLKEEWRLGTFDTKGYQREFEEVLSSIYGEQVKLKAYFDELQIQHTPRYSYGEQIAVLIEKTSERLSLSRSYESFAKKLISEEIPWEIGEELIDSVQTDITSSTKDSGDWSDPKITDMLRQALETFDWSRAEEICDDIKNKIRRDSTAIDEKFGERVLYLLRRYRQYAAISKLADAMLQSGIRSLQIRRQYAQSMIDQGLLTSAEGILQSIIKDSEQNRTEELQARGLIGRIYKQLYVTTADLSSTTNPANLERSVDAYVSVYRLNPKENLWHGINAVALVARAQRDGIALDTTIDATIVAKEILSVIQTREELSAEPLNAWEEAIRMEAYLAVGQIDDAIMAAMRYSEMALDSFEVVSELRQFEQVWQLNDTKRPGDLLLPTLRIAYLRRVGVKRRLSPHKVREEIQSLTSRMSELEAIVGHDKMHTYSWYKKGLETCDSIARIEPRSRRRVQGTGWLVNAADFFPNKDGVLLLTNSHILGPAPTPFSASPFECQVNFPVTNEILELEDEIVWSSPYTDLDATFLKLKGEPKAPPLRLYESKLEMSPRTPRLFMIAYEEGREPEISFQDCHLISFNDRLIHYRTPTYPGTSGGPVFDSNNWEVVGLYHDAPYELPHLDDSEGAYEANEAISISALRDATKRGFGGRDNAE